jgi:hypothetical protein
LRCIASTHPAVIKLFSVRQELRDPVQPPSHCETKPPSAGVQACRYPAAAERAEAEVLTRRCHRSEAAGVSCGQWSSVDPRTVQRSSMIPTFPTGDAHRTRPSPGRLEMLTASITLPQRNGKTERLVIAALCRAIEPPPNDIRHTRRVFYRRQAPGAEGSFIPCAIGSIG